STKLIEKELSGVTTLELVFRSKNIEGLQKLEVLQSMQDLKGWLGKQPQVDFVMSHADIVEEMNWAFHGEAEAQRHLPENQKMVSQYLLINSGETIWDFVNLDFTFSRMTVRLNIYG